MVKGPFRYHTMRGRWPKDHFRSQGGVQREPKMDRMILEHPLKLDYIQYFDGQENYTVTVFPSLLMYRIAVHLYSYNRYVLINLFNYKLVHSVHCRILNKVRTN